MVEGRVVGEPGYDEDVNLLRHGAGSFGVLCGIFSGLVGVIAVLVLMFWPAIPLFLYVSVMIVLFVFSSFVYAVAALLFVDVSMTSVRDEPFSGMVKDFELGRTLMLLATVFFFVGFSIMTYDLNVWYLMVVGVVGIVLAVVRFFMHFVKWVT